ncbi:MAG: NUDIX domain-containing protein [Ignavibacteria bacterium]|nr:NUDIX domain-containing protein [Ignavibacteria bacterium]
MSENWWKFTRPVALCLFTNNGRLLAAKGTDSVKQTEFYRPIGGMIEFGEYGTDAVQREIMEETGQKVKNVKYLGTLENIFVYEGKSGHEIVLMYDAEFVDKLMYEKEFIDIVEVDWCKAYWVNIEDCINGKITIYPDGIAELLGKLNSTNP